MLGAIINLLNASDLTSNVLSGYTLANTGISIFGPGRGSQTDMTVGEGVHPLTIFAGFREEGSSEIKDGNLNFENLTVNGTLIFDSPNYNIITRAAVVPTAIYPLILRCSGKLTINTKGRITADGQGNFNDTTHYQEDHREPIYCNIPLKDVVTESPGYSANSEVFDRLMQYGANGGFLDPYNFLCGASGGNYGYWKHNNWGSMRSRTYYSFSFTQGGRANYDPSRSGGRRNRNAGPTGGCIVLYFEELKIDGKIYGKDPDCDISVIQANGAFPQAGWEDACRGGGMMVIAARKIEINTDTSAPVLERGVITSNGILCHDYINANNLPYYGYTSAIKQWRWSVLNNYPQLGIGQSGWRYVKDGNIYRPIYEAMPSNVKKYYYDMGMGTFGEMSTETGYDADFLTSSHIWGGGAGIVLGFKVRSSKKEDEEESDD